MLASFSAKRKVTVWLPSVCLSLLSAYSTCTHQGAACDAASVHFCPTIRRTDILVKNTVQELGVHTQFLV